MTGKKALIGLLGIGAGLTAPIQDAAACGGFFCNNKQPVDQSAERILFAVDEEAGTVETHVQIFYQGDSQDFAWIVPVPEDPELFISTDQVFTTLDMHTAPQFRLEYVETGKCTGYYRGGYELSDSTAAPNDGGSGGGVSVIAEEEVGPYDAVTLKADSASELLDWLQDNGYDLPDDLDPALQPYVSGGQYFVAIKLQKDRDAGDIAPLGMTYHATKAMVPIQLTSVAATDDMRLEVYVLGDHRSVPESYLHVQINEAAVDWFDWGSNYESVISQAADEAGGHAFATDYTSSMADLLKPYGGANMFTWEGRFDTDALRDITDPIAFMEELMSQGFTGNSQLMSMLQTYLPMPQELVDKGVSEQDFYNWMWGYKEHLTDYTFDADAFADDLEAFIVEPLEHAEELTQSYNHISRMTSSLDAVEMTVDPVFTFNSDMEQTASNQHSATVVMLCGAGLDWYEAPRRFELEDGRSYDLPSEKELDDLGITEFEYMNGVTEPAALIIEETGAEGAPKTVADYNDYADALADEFNGDAETDAKAGCGCAAAPASTGALFLFGALGLGLRRRQDS